MPANIGEQTHVALTHAERETETYPSDVVQWKSQERKMKTDTEMIAWLYSMFFFF